MVSSSSGWEEEEGATIASFTVNTSVVAKTAAAVGILDVVVIVVGVVVVDVKRDGIDVVIFCAILIIDGKSSNSEVTVVDADSCSSVLI